MSSYNFTNRNPSAPTRSSFARPSSPRAVTPNNSSQHSNSPRNTAAASVGVVGVAIAPRSASAMSNATAATRDGTYRATPTPPPNHYQQQQHHYQNAAVAAAAAPLTSSAPASVRPFPQNSNSGGHVSHSFGFKLPKRSSFHTQSALLPTTVSSSSDAAVGTPRGITVAAASAASKTMPGVESSVTAVFSSSNTPTPNDHRLSSRPDSSSSSSRVVITGQSASGVQSAIFIPERPMSAVTSQRRPLAVVAQSEEGGGDAPNNNTTMTATSVLISRPTSATFSSTAGLLKGVNMLGDRSDQLASNWIMPRLAEEGSAATTTTTTATRLASPSLDGMMGIRCSPSAVSSRNGVCPSSLSRPTSAAAAPSVSVSKRPPPPPPPSSSQQRAAIDRDVHAFDDDDVPNDDGEEEYAGERELDAYTATLAPSASSARKQKERASLRSDSSAIEAPTTNIASSSAQRASSAGPTHRNDLGRTEEKQCSVDSKCDDDGLSDQQNNAIFTTVQAAFDAFMRDHKSLVVAVEEALATFKGSQERDLEGNAALFSRPSPSSKETDGNGGGTMPATAPWDLPPSHLSGSVAAMLLLRLSHWMQNGCGEVMRKLLFMLFNCAFDSAWAAGGGMLSVEEKEKEEAGSKTMRGRKAVSRPTSAASWLKAPTTTPTMIETTGAAVSTQPTRPSPFQRFSDHLVPSEGSDCGFLMRAPMYLSEHRRQMAIAKKAIAQKEALGLAVRRAGRVMATVCEKRGLALQGLCLRAWRNYAKRHVAHEEGWLGLRRNAAAREVKLQYFLRWWATTCSEREGRIGVTAGANTDLMLQRIATLESYCDKRTTQIMRLTEARDKLEGKVDRLLSLLEEERVETTKARSRLKASEMELEGFRTQAKEAMAMVLQLTSTAVISGGGASVATLKAVAARRPMVPLAAVCSARDIDAHNMKMAQQQQQQQRREEKESSSGTEPRSAPTVALLPTGRPSAFGSSTFAGGSSSFASQPQSSFVAFESPSQSTLLAAPTATAVAKIMSKPSNVYAAGTILSTFSLPTIASVNPNVVLSNARCPPIPPLPALLEDRERGSVHGGAVVQDAVAFALWWVNQTLSDARAQLAMMEETIVPAIAAMAAAERRQSTAAAAKGRRKSSLAVAPADAEKPLPQLTLENDLGQYLVAELNNGGRGGGVGSGGLFGDDPFPIADGDPTDDASFDADDDFSSATSSDWWHEDFGEDTDEDDENEGTNPLKRSSGSDMFAKSFEKGDFNADTRRGTGRNGTVTFEDSVVRQDTAAPRDASNSARPSLRRSVDADSAASTTDAKAPSPLRRSGSLSGTHHSVAHAAGAFRRWKLEVLEATPAHVTSLSDLAGGRVYQVLLWRLLGHAMGIGDVFVPKIGDAHCRRQRRSRKRLLLGGAAAAVFTPLPFNAETTSDRCRRVLRMATLLGIDGGVTVQQLANAYNPHMGVLRSGGGVAGLTDLNPNNSAAFAHSFFSTTESDKLHMLFLSRIMSHYVHCTTTSVLRSGGGVASSSSPSSASGGLPSSSHPFAYLPTLSIEGYKIVAGHDRPFWKPPPTYSSFSSSPLDATAAGRRQGVVSGIPSAAALGYSVSFLTHATNAAAAAAHRSASPSYDAASLFSASESSFPRRRSAVVANLPNTSSPLPSGVETTATRMEALITEAAASAEAFGQALGRVKALLAISEQWKAMSIAVNNFAVRCATRGGGRSDGWNSGSARPSDAALAHALAAPASVCAPLAPTTPAATAAAHPPPSSLLPAYASSATIAKHINSLFTIEYPSLTPMGAGLTFYREELASSNPLMQGAAGGESVSSSLSHSSLCYGLNYFYLMPVPAVGSNVRSRLTISAEMVQSLFEANPIPKLSATLRLATAVSTPTLTEIKAQQRIMEGGAGALANGVGRGGGGAAERNSLGSCVLSNFENINFVDEVETDDGGDDEGKALARKAAALYLAQQFNTVLSPHRNLLQDVSIFYASTSSTEAVETPLPTIDGASFTLLCETIKFPMTNSGKGVDIEDPVVLAMLMEEVHPPREFGRGFRGRSSSASAADNGTLEAGATPLSTTPSSPLGATARRRSSSVSGLGSPRSPASPQQQQQQSPHALEYPVPVRGNKKATAVLIADEVRARAHALFLSLCEAYGEASKGPGSCFPSFVLPIAITRLFFLWLQVLRAVKARHVAHPPLPFTCAERAADWFSYFVRIAVVPALEAQLRDHLVHKQHLLTIAQLPTIGIVLRKHKDNLRRVFLAYATRHGVNKNNLGGGGIGGGGTTGGNSPAASSVVTATAAGDAPPLPSHGPSAITVAFGIHHGYYVTLESFQSLFVKQLRLVEGPRAARVYHTARLANIGRGSVLLVGSGVMVGTGLSPTPQQPLSNANALATARRSVLAANTSNNGSWAFSSPLSVKLLSSSSSNGVGGVGGGVTSPASPGGRRSTINATNSATTTNPTLTMVPAGVGLSFDGFLLAIVTMGLSHKSFALLSDDMSVAVEHFILTALFGPLRTKLNLKL